MIVRLVIALVAFFVAAPVFAFDLLDVFRQAQLNDATYAAAKAQYRAQQERLPQARAGLLPNASFDAGYDYNDLDVQYSSLQFNSGQRDFESYDYGISISQPLFRRQNRLSYDQASRSGEPRRPRPPRTGT